MLKPVKIMLTGILLAAMIPVSAMALYDPDNVVEPVEGEMRIMTAVGAPDESVSSPEIPEATLKRQQEVDVTLFKMNYEKLSEMGIKVTQTSPIGDVVEIGIEPFTKENANVIYELVGPDGVTVVEGNSAIIYATTDVGVAPDATAGGETGSSGGAAASGDADKILTTTVVDDAVVDQAANSGIVPADDGVMTITGEELANPLAESQAAPQNQAVQMMTYLFAIAAAVILGAAVFIFRRIKAVKMH